MMQSSLDMSTSAFAHTELLLLEQIQSAGSFDAIRGMDVPTTEMEQALSVAVLNLHLLGRAQVWADVAEPQVAEPPRKGANRASQAVLAGSVDPLPFDEAIAFFRSKTNLSPEAFYALTEAARTKAFTVAVGTEEAIIEAIRDLVDSALSEGLTLREFQRMAADVLSRAGVSAATPWYWETVYRTNLQQSYQVGRWQQMADPVVAAERPYIRYISARIPTSRPSHVEKHGLVYPQDHPFWDEFFPPNGFNCAPAGALVNTAQGQVPIENVTHGDLVLTHKGRWQRVTELHQNLFHGELVRITMSDGRILRLTPNHKVFTRRGWIEAASLNTSDETCDYSASLRERANSLSSAPAPGCSEIASGQIVQRDSLCLDKSMTLHQHVCLAGGASIPVAFNTNFEVRQVEVHPVGRERSIEDVANAGSVQDAREDGLPFRHRRFCVHVGRRVLSIPGNLCRGHFPSDFWPACRRTLFQFFRRTRETWMSQLRVALRPMVMCAEKFRHLLFHAHSLCFAPLGVASPLQGNRLSAGPLGNVEEVQQFGDRASRVDLEDSADFVRSFHFFTIQPPQDARGVFAGEGSNTINNDSERVSHSSCIIHKQREFIKIKTLEQEPFSGTVYNLGVAEDESYCVEGLALHNCRCSTMSVSNSLLSRRGWKVSTDRKFKYPEADEGFRYNPGKTEAI